MPVEGMPPVAEATLNKLLKDHIVTSMRILYDRDETEVHFKVSLRDQTMYYSRVANWVDRSIKKNPNRFKVEQKFARMKKIKGLSYDRVYKNAYDPFKDEPAMIPLYRNKGQALYGQHEGEEKDDAPKLSAASDKSHDSHKQTSGLWKHTHDGGLKPGGACPDCRMLGFLDKKKLNTEELSCAEILAVCRGLKLEKARAEMRVTDPQLRKHLLDPTRNTYIHKVVFDSGPKNAQRLLIGGSEDVILVYDCDAEKLCTWCLRRNKSEIKKRDDFYIQTQLDLTRDVGTVRYQRQTLDLQQQLNLLMTLLKEYAQSIYKCFCVTPSLPNKTVNAIQLQEA